MVNMNDHSVNVGASIVSSIVQTGDNNRASLTATPLPDAASVDIAAVIAALRDELLAVDAPDRGKIERALIDAQEEAAKPEPDRGEVGSALGRALGYAGKAAELSENIGKIRDLVTQAGGWLGAASPYAVPLLAAIGLAPL
ncbi:MAG TPA: hypothetical protein VIA98_04310 [Allosphingosinicella sp.]|jgi:Flp pilus assembly protein TadD